MKKMSNVEKSEYLIEVMESDLTPEEKAKKLEFFKDDYEVEHFIKLSFHDIYLAVLDNLGIKKYTGKSELLKHVAKIL